MTDSTAPIPDESPQWRRTLWTMVAVQFTMSVAFSIVQPVMPLFLPDLGVASPAAVDMWAGVLAAATSFVAIFTAPIWGSLADRYGRKLMVLRSTLGIAIFTFLMGLAQSPWHMLALRAGMGALAGFNSASTVMVASQVPERRLGYALGWLSTGNLVGSLIGPVIGGGIADITGSYRYPFWFAGIIGLAAFVVTLVMVPERFTRPAESTRKGGLIASLSALLRAGGLAPVIMVMMMAQFATQAVGPVVTLFVREMLGNRPDIATLGGVAFAVTGLAGGDRGAAAVAAGRYLGLSANPDDQPGGRGLILGAAGFAFGLLGLRGGAVWTRPVCRCRGAGRQCPGRAVGQPGPARVGLWDDLISLFFRQYLGAADGRHGRGDGWD